MQAQMTPCTATQRHRPLASAPKNCTLNEDASRGMVKRKSQKARKQAPMSGCPERKYSVLGSKNCAGQRSRNAAFDLARVECEDNAIKGAMRVVALSISKSHMRRIIPSIGGRNWKTK